MQLPGSLTDSPERAWLAALVAGVLALAGAALAFPRQVYDGFIWRYFWGPVHADARAADCAYRYPDGRVRLGREVREELDVVGDACDPALVEQAVYATPGYTTVSTVGYMVVLVFMLLGVYFLLQRVDLRPYREFVIALVPWMLLGGALRVVEDVTDRAVEATGVEPIIAYPLNALLISPVIYGTVFLLALAGLLVAKYLQREGTTDTYHYPLGGMGLAGLVATLAYLTYLGLTTTYVAFHPLIVTTVVGLATAIAVAIYYGAERVAPRMHAGTGLVGLVVVWGHAVDGVANVAAADWVHRFYPDVGPYGAKHVFNQFLIDLTEAVQPAEVSALIGTSWPFLVVKVIVATGIVFLFDEAFVEESPRYSMILLGAVIAVGLGPGTRDVLRVTFGI